MLDLVQRALSAKRESKCTEFKAGFDPGSAADWVEIIKDIVAIANSGGGVIIFGLNSLGSPTGMSPVELGKTDPADFGNKVSKYTGTTHPEFEIREVEKVGQKLLAFVIEGAPIPIVFQKPGTYDVGAGKQKTAFGMGTVYFRHGAKSEPGSSDDIRSVFERRLESIRKSWIKNVRKVVQAPQGSEIIAVPSRGQGGATSMPHMVHAVRDPDAMPVRLTRDRQKSTGSFVHESVSEGIFDEINNVIDANRALARGQPRFFLGQAIYYRIYAERQFVFQRAEDLNLLLHSSVCDFYAPCLYWVSMLQETAVAHTLADLYLQPRNPTVHTLLRLALILGDDFSDRLFEKWHTKWRGHSQPPGFYFAFKEMRSSAKNIDPCLAALRIRSSRQLQVGKQLLHAEELLQNPQKAGALLSQVCMDVFETNDAELRSLARNLDLFAYAQVVQRRGLEISRAFWKLVGNKETRDVVMSTED
jgi:Putative DNA-binding domain